MNTLQFEVDLTGVAVITLDLPERTVNVVTAEMAAELEQAIERVMADPALRGAVLTSAKSSFIVGALAANGLDRCSRLMHRIETGGKPFACAINGLALGSGLELAMACHWCVLADDAKALIGLPAVTLDLRAAGESSPCLPHRLGIEKALSLSIRGEYLSPRKALELGIVDQLGPRERLVAQARDWVLMYGEADESGIDAAGHAPAWFASHATSARMSPQALAA